MNKKGLVKPNALILAAFFIAIVLVGGFFIASVLGRPSIDLPAQEVSNDIQAQSSLLSYLKTPIGFEINGKNHSLPVSEFIQLAKSNSSYASVLEKETRDIFEKVYPEGYGVWIAGVLAIDETTKILPVTKGRTKTIKSQSGEATVSLPRDIQVRFAIK